MQTETPAPIPQPPLHVEEPTPPVQEPRPIYHGIIVEPPPALEVFSSYSTLPDGNPPSFANALRGPDHQTWIKAMIGEIDALQAMKTW
jgi:hypothetical protein